MIAQIKITDEAVCEIVANDGHGIISIDDFYQLSEKSMEGLCWVLRRPGGNTGGVSYPEVVV